MARIRLERWTVAALGALTILAIVAPVAARRQTWAGVLAALVCLAAIPWAARALPSSLDGVARRRPVVSLLWVALAVIAVLQMGRLSAFMADASREWGSTVPGPLATHHQCMSAYVYAADLSRRGVDNVYHAKWYPLFDPPGPTCRLVESPVRGLAAWASDPFEYPPPFLLLPRAALMLTSSYDTIRAWWFVIQALGFVACGVAFAAWIGGAAGLTVGLLIPALLASLETMFALQFGQFHVVVMLLAVAAMIAIASRQRAWGGALLAAAIVSKVFPAILLVPLAVRREWKALGWTAAFAGSYALLGLAVLGPKPYGAFFGYQLPRIASGAAFHFTHLGAHATFLISRNMSIAGLEPKLDLLSAPSWTHGVSAALVFLYALAVVGLAWWTAGVDGRRDRQALVWIGLLNLAALRSPEAPASYALAPVLWLLVLLATRLLGRGWRITALAAAWVVVAGPPPLPDAIEMPVGLVLQGFALALCFAAVAWGSALQKPAEGRAASAVPERALGLPV